MMGYQQGENTILVQFKNRSRAFRNAVAKTDILDCGGNPNPNLCVFTRFFGNKAISVVPESISRRLHSFDNTGNAFCQHIV